jgi:hypothetical protein
MSKFYKTGATIDESYNLALQDVRNNPEMADFTKRFKDYTDVSKPAETNGLAKIKVFREEVRIPSPLGLTGIVIRTPPEDTVSTKE